MKAGDNVIYRGIKQVIEDVSEDSVMIMNNLWQEDSDDEFIPFWIWVKISDID